MAMGEVAPWGPGRHRRRSNASDTGERSRPAPHRGRWPSGQQLDLKKYIRDIPDFPTQGTLFRDITPLLQNAGAFRSVIDALADYCIRRAADTIVGIDARGFLFSAPVAYRLVKPLVPVRKRGKLPFDTHQAAYTLEYGDDAIEIHRDGIALGDRVVVVDDLLATGGTMSAAAKLVERTGGVVTGVGVVVELTELKGRSRLDGYDVHSLVQY